MPTIHLTSLGDPYCIFSYNLFFDLLYHILTRIWIIKEVSNYMYVLRDASFLASHVIIFFYHEQNNICKTATALGNNILKNKYGMLLDYFCNTHKIQPRLEFGHMLLQWFSHLTNYMHTYSMYQVVIILQKKNVFINFLVCTTFCLLFGIDMDQNDMLQTVSTWSFIHINRTIMNHNLDLNRIFGSKAKR